MKIDQNVIFLKNLTDSPPALSARDGVKRLASTTPALAAQVHAVSASPLLPSTNGDFDAARVAKIRQDISAGNYQVNTAKIADGLIDTVRDLLSKKAP